MLELGAESARLHAEAAREIAQRKPRWSRRGAFARAFESLREALGGRLITAADAELSTEAESALRATSWSCSKRHEESPWNVSSTT